MDKFQVDWLQKTTAIIGILGPVVNLILFMFLGFFYPGYNPISQFISELGTSDAPTNVIMNILGFNLFGIYMILFGIGINRGIEKHVLTTISMVLFIFSGIILFSLSKFPCDLGCKNVTLLGIVHNILIKFPSITIPLAIILLIYPLWKDHKWKNYSWLFFVQVGIFLIIFSPISILLSAFPTAGLIQRLGLSVPISYILIMSTKLYRLAG
ncbi:MAG: DUF998 domain-containing protein [Promethearchaeota archaeon]